MTHLNRQTGKNSDAYATAADWHTRMDDADCGPVDRARLDVWLSEDPRNAEAYRAVERVDIVMRQAGADPRILAFRHDALAAVSWKRRFSPIAAWQRVSARPLKFLAAAAVVLIVAGVALFASLALHAPAVGPTRAGQKLDAGIFTTAIGERSTVALSDGSSIVLDTQSRIDVSYSPQQRAVRLVSGQAWFQVAHDAAWPFVVDAGDRRIIALGTAFDVRLDDHDDTVRVTLAEGKVAVEAIQSPLTRLIRSAPAASVLLPGDSLVVSGANPALSRRADVAKVGSWRQGQVIFDDDTLESAIAEMNRYSTRRIVLADPSLATLRVSGVFNAGHSRNFIEAVTSHYAIAAEEVDGRVVLKPR